MIVVNSRFLTQKITGTQRFAIEISKRLMDKDLDITFVSPQNIIQQELGNKLKVKKIGRLTIHLWEQIELRKYLKKNNYPLLLNFVNTAPMFYKNQIVTIHDLSFLRYPKWFSKKIHLAYKYLIPNIAKYSRKIITVSQFSKREIKELLNIEEKKIEVIYNAVSDSFKYDNNVPKENFILTVSSLGPRKNFKNLILAFKKLKLNNYKLLIVGNQNKAFLYTELRNLIKDEKNVEFTGYVSDEKLINLYQRAKIFVYPSFYEGFGIPPLEAMACGTPVVVSKAASLPEVCGDAAYYVDPYDIDSIAKGMEAVLTDEKLQKELIKKGLERVKLFSWEKSARKVLNIIKEVA